MSFALVTIIAPLARERLPDAQARIGAFGNPARDDLREKLDQLDGSEGTHFCSFHAVRSKNRGKAYLALEFSADGTPEEAVSRIARAVGTELAHVFCLASDWNADGQIGAFLDAHRVKIGVGLFANPGLAFAGTPGMTVGRIRSERRLAAAAVDILSPLDPKLPALRRLEEVRERLAGEPDVADLLETGRPLPPFLLSTGAGLFGQLILSFVGTYLWPLVLLVLAAALVGGFVRVPVDAMVWSTVGTFLLGAVKWLLIASLIAFPVALVVLVSVYFELRSLESRDSAGERRPDKNTLDAMFVNENRCAQNHMLSVTQRKPGGVRSFTLRLAFWVIGELAARQFRPGFLGQISSIHFARWVSVPGTRDLLFFSNYDSSWESYLEDFITRAHNGLTGIWSNTIGFPPTENLFQRGATDGERFKRFARESMAPTPFWYSAYPKLTTTEIRNNAAIRLGLSGALTEDEASSWLALFGSAPRPAGTLVSREIQSIVFGGLGKDMPFGTCAFYALPATVDVARSWLADVLPHVAFGDGRWLKHEAVVTLALAPAGLGKLGLSEEALHSFPHAFLNGMTERERTRMLGDTGDNEPARWRWGRETPDAALLIYGKTDEEVARLEADLFAVASLHGARHLHRVPLKRVKHDQREPFGFADGISQPVIRGTYKGLKAADPIHLVEPGEFILGYPDGRGNMPPGPTLSAMSDPRNMLPLVEATGDFTRNFVDGTRDLGRNGSFLVIRELEQDVDRFKQYCADEANKLKDRLPQPYEIKSEFIAAKLVGRWQNGSSLVRHPYFARNDYRPGGCHDEAPATPNSDPGQATERPIAPAVAAAGGASAPVPRPAKASHLQDNDFLFGTEDPEALRCPFGAHIRRANPRDSLTPGSKDEIDISNRHRIIRIGRLYQEAAGSKPGLFFMCLNADIERQFEFVQQTWLRSPSFHGLTAERDPLLGEGDTGTCGFTIPTRHGPIKLAQVPAVVATRGGGYFFLPGKRLLDFLISAS